MAREVRKVREVSTSRGDGVTRRRHGIAPPQTSKHRTQAPLRRFDEDRWWRYCLWATRAAGPTAVKLAQWASSREDRFPRAFCDRFAHLQDRAPAHAWRDTERALEASLGPDWRDVLDVDAAPVGTGCVAQVHSAVRGGVLFFGVAASARER